MISVPPFAPLSGRFLFEEIYDKLATRENPFFRSTVSVICIPNSIHLEGYGILEVGWFPGNTATLGCVLRRTLHKGTAQARVLVLPKPTFKAKLDDCPSPGSMGIYLTICVPSHPGDLCKIIISSEGVGSTFTQNASSEAGSPPENGPAKKSSTRGGSRHAPPRSASPRVSAPKPGSAGHEQFPHSHGARTPK